MRLTDDIMRAAENATAARIGNALLLSSAGRFGLFPCSRPFQLSLNINPEYVEVQALDCLAITKGGYLIDVQYDTHYSNHLENRVQMPVIQSSKELYLTINVHPEQWEETIDGYEEPVYTFSLLGTNSPIADNALPIAHLVDTDYGGWHLDEIDFVPPCLFVSSHHKYEESLNRFLQNLTEVESKLYRLLQTETDEAFRIFWPFMQQILIDTDKNRDSMTPMMLLANIQKFVGAFTTACQLDRNLILTNANSFRNYALKPYNYQNVYPMIKEGLEFSLSINEKLDNAETKEPEMPQSATPIATPSIANEQLYQNCRSSNVFIPIINSVPEATVVYSTDGGASFEEAKLKGSQIGIRLRNNFNSLKEPEPDQTVNVKLKAILNGVVSDVNTFTLTFHKDYKVWIKI